jgi:MFS family permease
VNTSPPPVGRGQVWLASVAHGFQSLRIRNFRLFWVGQIISLTGTWMQTTAQAWLVLKLTQDSPFALGIVTTLQFLPVMVFALYGGVLADRLPKRPTLIITQTLLMIQAAIFGGLVATGNIQLWHIYVLAVVQGFITAIDNPVRLAFIYEMVGREDLINAVGLNSMSFQGARIFGPATAGILINVIGIAPALIFNAVSFIPVIWAFFLMDPKKLFATAATPAGSMFSKLKEGLTFSLHTPVVFAILIVAAFIGTFGFNFTIIVPLVADNVLKTDASGYGFLNAAMGIGALISSLVTAYSSQVTLRRLLISGGLFSIFLGTLAVSNSFWFSMALFVIVGFTGITCATAVNSLLQLNTPDHLRGRVISINVLLTVGSTPIGGFFLGTLAQLAGVEVALVSCAVLCVIGIVLASFYSWRLSHPVPAVP